MTEQGIKSVEQGDNSGEQRGTTEHPTRPKSSSRPVCDAADVASQASFQHFVVLPQGMRPKRGADLPVTSAEADVGSARKILCGWIAACSQRQSGVAQHIHSEMMMQDHKPEDQTAIRTDLGAIFVSLELSRSTWLVTSLSPGGGEKMSKHSVPGGDISGLLMLFSRLTERARKRAGEEFPIIAIQEAGLDGFWIHRTLEQEGIESHIVDAASIMTSRRRRRAKTDRIDGEALLRALMAYKRGEPRVCAMVRVPTPDKTKIAVGSHASAMS